MQQQTHQEASPASTDGSLKPVSPVSEHMIKNLEEQAGINAVADNTTTVTPGLAVDRAVTLATQRFSQPVMTDQYPGPKPSAPVDQTAGFIQIMNPVPLTPSIPAGQAVTLQNTEQGVIIGDVIPEEKKEGFATIDYHEFSSQAEGEGQNEPGATRHQAHLRIDGRYLADQMQNLIEFLREHLSERTQGELARSFASLVVPLNVNGHAMAFVAIGNVFENNTNTTVCALVPSHQGQRVLVGNKTFFDIHFGTFTASFSQEAIDEVMSLVRVK